MTPSFLYQLYRRSRYSAMELPPGTPAQSRNNQSEVFAVAALGFTLRHEPRFLEYFLREVCRISNVTNASEYDIRCQDGHKSDLAIVRPGHQVIVIEAKIAADLEPKQNPTFLDFAMEPSGYGFQINRDYPKELERFYAVLARDITAIPDGRNICRTLRFQGFLPWADLERMPNQSEIVTDFLSCLGYLGVPHFKYMTTKQSDNLTLTPPDASVASKALSILGDTAIELGFGEGQYWPEASCAENWFGVHVGKVHSKAKEYPKQLRDAVSPDSKAWLAWYGYEYDDHQINPSVWFYCTEEKRAKLLKKLAAFQPKQGSESDPFVVVRCKVQHSGGDKKWFLTVLRSVM